MGGEWREVPFSNVIDFQEGPGILAKDFRDEGVPLVRLSGLDRGSSVLAGCNYLDPEMVARKWSHFALAKGDILLSTSASLGRIAVVGDDGVGAIPYTGIIRMRPRDASIVAPFIRYLLEGPDFQQQAEVVGAGSVIRHFGPTHLRQMTVRLPPPDEQRAIAHILGTLDDKIELNRKQNETLEAMARALFRAWFVDFEPVRAKLEGRWQRGQSLPGLPAHLYDLFPDRLVESELGEIPEGWEMQPLSEVLTIIGGGTPKTSVKEYWDGDIPWFSVVDTPAASDVFVVSTEKTITSQGLAGSSARLIPKGTTIISARGTVGNLAIAGREMTFNQSCYGLRGTGYAGDYFVYLTAQRMIDQLKSMAHGSVFSTITRQTFEAIQRPVPQPAVLTAFEGLVAAWFEAILANVEQSRTLATLRDTLLPKLISGEVRVKDAERFLEERGL
ncbi:restriction endonuclease subunit S [Meiothermus sp.]|uniref:restriction endonuclease subunit S n=1 Tax=Meiothermus sp. TaxID=1955249 RepID=UPI0021DC8ABE|nr:restriction endonuclease subunit S [Meiothermus sp.]GIW33851.1 MAG: type I restriction system specificity protein [Meiothermus sp.]